MTRTAALALLLVACRRAPATEADDPPVRPNAPPVLPAPPSARDPHRLQAELTETEPCQDGPGHEPATATGIEGAVVVEARGVQRECHAGFSAAAFWDPPVDGGGNGTVTLQILEHEDPPYFACICFRDLRIRIADVKPGPYHVVSPRLSLETDVTVPAGPRP